MEWYMKQELRADKARIYHPIKAACSCAPHATSSDFSYWLQKNRYYHEQVVAFYRLYIPKGATILQINCKNGYALSALESSFALGVDSDAYAIAQAKQRYQQLSFFAGTIDDVTAVYEFDYIILSLITMEVDDVQELLQQVQRFCHAGTRIIIETYSSWWQPILLAAQRCGLRRPTIFKNWLSRYDIENIATIAGFERVSQGSYVLAPVRVPILSSLCNHLLSPLPFIRRLNLINWMIVRPANKMQCASETTVSVVIPCRNERGNIQAAVERCPSMGKHTEIIFVEGNSHDGTLEEIYRVAALYPERSITILVQDGKGKGDAVRKAFECAKGDILMILDGDLAVPPEELPKFFDAMVQGKGEFINGSRLIYRMEAGAMGKASYLANWGIGVLVSWVLGQRVKDTLCGTKVLWKKDYTTIAAQRHFFGFQDPFGDFDLLFGAARLNLKIVDLPVHYKQRTYGRTNINRLKDVWLLWWMGIRALIRLKLKWL